MTKAILRYAAIVVVLVAGCSPAGRKQHVSEKLPGVDMISADRGQIKDGGILRVAQQSYPRNFNFHQIDGLTVSQVQETTAPYFFTFDAAGDPVLNTDYATSIRVTNRIPSRSPTRSNRRPSGRTGHRSNSTTSMTTGGPTTARTGRTGLSAAKVSRTSHRSPKEPATRR